MLFDKPEGANPIDRGTVVGKATSRIDGALKVSGKARYAYETTGRRPRRRLRLHCRRRGSQRRHLVSSTRAPPARAGLSRRWSPMRTRDAEEGEVQHRRAPGGAGRRALPSGRRRRRVRDFRTGPRGGRNVARRLQGAGWRIRSTQQPTRQAAASRQSCGGEPSDDSEFGAFRSRLRRGAGQARQNLHDARSSPCDDGAARHIRGMELATSLTFWTSSQMVDWHRSDLSTTLGDAKGQHAHRLQLSSAAASAPNCFSAPTRCSPRWRREEAGRPVKLALPRPFVFNNTTHRPATIQRIRIGADATERSSPSATKVGRAISRTDGRRRRLAQTRLLYGGANRATSHAACRDRLAGGQRHARARRGAGHDGARDRHGRDGGATAALIPSNSACSTTSTTIPNIPRVRSPQRELTACLKTRRAEIRMERAPTASRGRCETANWWIGLGVAAGVS